MLLIAESIRNYQMIFLQGAFIIMNSAMGI